MIVVVAVAVGAWLADGHEADPNAEVQVDRTNGPAKVATRRVEPVRDPVEAQPEPEPEPELEPLDDTPTASQPREDEAWSLLKLPLTCKVEPPLVGPPVVGKVTPVTWPGPDHEALTDGVDQPVIPIRVTVKADELTGTTFLPARDANGEPIRHVARLVVAGFAPTDFTFVTTGPDEPVTCDRPIKLVAAAQGVVGTVRHEDGTPAEGAIVSGCGTQSVTGTDGDYFLLPRAATPCSLRARHAPGSVAESAPQQVASNPTEDQILEFVVAVPEQPEPGVDIFRTDEGEVWIRPEDSGPWARELPAGARILRVGDVPPTELSDEELLRALVTLDAAVVVEQYLETADGEGVRANVSITEL